MAHELIVSFPGPLRDAVLVDDSAPLPVASAPAAAAASQASVKEKQDREALQRVLTQLTEVAEELQKQQRQRLEEMQQVAVELAVAIASRLIHERLEKGEYAIDALVRQAVERLETEQPVTVYLHPLDLALLESRVAKSERPLLPSASIRLHADDKLGRGDCRAEAGHLSVLTKVQEQLVEIRRHLLETLPEATLDRRKPDRTLRRFPDRRHTA